MNNGIRKPIGTTACEKDQGFYIRSDLKWVDQANYAASKANRVLVMLRKTFISEIVSYGRSCIHR